MQLPVHKTLAGGKSLVAKQQTCSPEVDGNQNRAKRRAYICQVHKTHTQKNDDIMDSLVFYTQQPRNPENIPQTKSCCTICLKSPPPSEHCFLIGHRFIGLNPCMTFNKCHHHFLSNRLYHFSFYAHYYRKP